MSPTVIVDALPFALETVESAEWNSDDATVTSVALALTDLFVDPGGDVIVSASTSRTASRLLGECTDETFQFSARVTVDFRALFDAGALLVVVDQDNWAKLCFEYGPEGQAMVVSVVTRGVSDDANAFSVDANECWLRITRAGRLLAFHASLDGTRWSLVRVFSLPHLDSAVQLGFLVQSPTGDGCHVAFDDVRYSTVALTELRSGA